jgi:3-hydroxyisobutyrate dehydrogenase
MKERVGFIGLGDIGTPMARRILAGGFQVYSSAHRRRDAIELLKESGLVEAASPYEVALQTKVLASMVVDEAQTDAVLRGPKGALAGLASGSIVIVMSTVSPEYCKSLAAEAAETGIDILDCPVAGGRPRAERGALALICGGDSKVVERSRPILETMGTVFHCGPIGMGQVVKLANNGLVASQFQLVQEVRAMAEAYEMDLSALMKILSRSTGTSFVVENWDFLETNWRHMGRMAKKDIDLCLAAAKAKNVSMPLVEAACELAVPWANTLGEQRGT